MGPIHKRLLGTWRSDKKRTLSTWRAYAEFSLSKKRKVGAIFGKVEVRYTPSFYFMKLNGHVVRDRYDVVAEDRDSIVLRLHSDAFKKTVDPFIRDLMEECLEPKLWHLQFDEQRRQDFYWIGLRVMCEWFRKIS